jgi:DNA-directed RNA polymerase specialized sigma24 family protein
MSQTLGKALAALLGAAAVSGTTEEMRAEPTVWAHETTTVTGAEPADARSLRHVLEARMAAAERAGQYDAVDDLATLWLTLSGRNQLDRVVERPDQFVRVALRNQRRSEQRSEGRTRLVLTDPVDLDPVAGAPAPYELLDAEQFLQGLGEPYQTALGWTLTGMNHREVAEQMGVSHAATRKWAQRLREQLGDDPFDA